MPSETTLAPAVDVKEEPEPNLTVPSGKQVSWTKTSKAVTKKLAQVSRHAVATVLTLALAIRANAVVFSLMNAFILRQLNVPHAESLYGLWRHPANNMPESYPDYLDPRDHNHSFDALVAYNAAEIGLDTGEGPSRSWAE